MPPAHPRAVGNPFGDPVFRAQLSRAILGEIEQATGQTPWNANRDGVPATRVTEIRLDLAVATQAIVPRVNRVVTEAPPARAQNEAETWVVPQNRLADTRTQILNFLIALVVINFVLNILILCHILSIRFL